ncbi:hypothetical protein DSO57_1019174 [Entomophthora muscae]|uniref:Uncharacterized protein n=1 Tax=Entomophthora muscae TaxID=34485 RepID=A0ACC2TRS9_9FUNG|nr:hypothetical protein DSO57_1019174 [Entomophthora muscae]
MALNEKDQELQALAEGVNLQPRVHFDHTFKTPYPLIDNDPHFLRVVRYFRAQDYLAWAAGAAAFPALFYTIETYEKSVPKNKLGRNLGVATLLGTIGGFLFSYQNSSKRFWGWSENERERLKDLAEMRIRFKEGKPLYGTSNLDTYYQQVASNNSRYSALKMSAIPWFNFVNHNYHGVDTEKYAEEE